MKLVARLKSNSTFSVKNIIKEWKQSLNNKNEIIPQQVQKITSLNI